MSQEIVIIDYGMGNLKSLANALAYLALPHRICTAPADLADCSHVIIPGVGAYQRAMDNLAERGFIPALQAHVAAGRPLLGICLGMQLLSSTGSEPATCRGLGLIPGQVIALPESPAHPTPHVGWNSVTYTRSHPVFDNLKHTVDFYYVHSYHFKPAVAADALALTGYGSDFAAIVARANIVGVQFHPEKSQEQGLKLLENFVNWDGQC